jgi:glucose/arabinose dehydrogenase
LNVAVMAAVLGVVLVSPIPTPAQAAQPQPGCQAGFLQAAPPTTSEQCVAPGGGPQVPAAVPVGFQESVVLSGLVNPTAIRFAADGRVFVAEKSGNIKVFDNLADTTPTVFSALQTNVHNFWDRGLLGLALDPSLTGGTGNGPYVYVLYAYDHILGAGGTAPRWGDTCPTPPGATTDGCVISGRLSRFTVSGSTISGPEQVLIEDWCQQFPSHSIGSLVFGPDGALYLSAGDGASFNAVDYGQYGGGAGSPTPVNPCGDPPGGTMSPPAAEGGALRSQDVRTTGGSANYRGVILADSPVAYWRLGEPSGTNANDEIANRDGTYVGTPGLGVAGAIVGDTDTAVDLNGSTQYATVPDDNAFSIGTTGVLTVELWAKPDASSPDGVLVAKTGNGSNYEWAVLAANGFSGTVWNLAGGGVAFGSQATYVASRWRHVVVIFDSTNQRIREYVDGVGPLDDTDPWTNLPIGNGTGLVHIGRRGDAVSPYAGLVDDVAIYNYALTPGQVSAHFAAGTTGGGGSGDPTGLDGSILRLDPATGAGMPGNPFAGSSDANARRIIAYGLRNPFRITTRPGTNELWVGDVGWNTWEEINRIPDATDAVAENFGWPCYEGVGRQSGYDGANLDLCENLYAQGTGAVAAPYYTYNHANKVVTNETCPTGSSSITGMAFYPETGGSYPAAYRGGVFFADHSRNCIWFIPKGTNGQPNSAAIQTFIAPAAGPVDLVIGPNSDLFYVDFDGGTIRRITATGANQSPTAVIQASPTSGPAPLTVQFNGGGSTDPEGTALTYAWDLDGDGAYDDGTGVTASWTYTSAGNVTTGLRVTDAGSPPASGTASQVISVGNSPPVPVISAPTSALHWKVGDLINFSGSASDAQDGNLPPSALSWSLVIQHCPSNCHTHQVQTWPGVASGSFNAPDHEYPSYLELTLTATDSGGASASTTVRLDPQTVVLSFQTSPSGLSLAVNQASTATPFTRTVIIGSANSVTATSPQTLNGLSYGYSSWSDGLAQSHTIVAPTTNTTYTATYTSTSFAVVTSADALIRWNKATTNFGTLTYLRTRSGQYRSYVQFTVSGLSGPASSAKLRLWVTDASSTAGSAYLVASTWTETGITWNNAPVITGSALSTIGAAPLGTWVEFDVGAAITGNGTYSFAISGGSTDAVDFASREAANKPTLVITP